MSFASKLDQLHAKVRASKWRGYFAVFLRIALAWGFLPSGFVKIMGERFTVLTPMHPMGHYLDAVYRTGFYYTAIGISQLTAAILLLIPRTALLGAIMYFPIILNICLVSISVRFEGSLFSSPMMVLADLYLLFWDYHRLKYIFPLNHNTAKQLITPQSKKSKFPFLFFGGVLAVTALLLLSIRSFEIQPRNTMKDCRSQCEDSKYPAACEAFCDCIHKQGQSLDSCLKVYNLLKRKATPLH